MKATVRNNVQVSGDGRTAMLFAHGFGCDQHMWRYVAPAFQDDFKVVLFDYVGHGNSRFAAYSSEKYSSLTGYVSDVIEICEELELENIVFVGHSVSAMVGALASIASPTLIAKLVMIGPSPCYLNDGDYHGGFTRDQVQELLDFLDSNPMGWSSMMAPMIMGNPERPELAEELRESFCRTDPNVEREFARVTFLSDNRQDLHKVSVPTLVMQCSDDVIAPLSVGQYVHQAIPWSILSLLQARGHCPQLSAPEETVQVLRQFLKYSRGKGRAA